MDGVGLAGELVPCVATHFNDLVMVGKAGLPNRIAVAAARRVRRGSSSGE
ncbi:hypothetical protein [Methyloglobulus sp.]